MRQEKIKELKPRLKSVYSNLYTGVADLYVYFYGRAMQLTSSSGVLSFISPSKWFRADYGKKLRSSIAEKTTVLSITDFGDLPVFESATAYPMVFIAQKGDRERATTLTEVETLSLPYPDVSTLIKNDGKPLPHDAFDGYEWSLMDEQRANRLKRMRRESVPLVEYVEGKIYYGVKTGFNEAFFINSKKREQLISDDPKSVEVIKPMVVGKDIRQWTADYKDRWLIFTKQGIDIRNYPAVEEHLSRWQRELTPKSNSGDRVGRKPGTYKWFEIQDTVAYHQSFDTPKILYPVMVKNQRFAFDTIGSFTNDKAFLISRDDLYLLGVLNSSSAWDAITSVCSKLRGGFYELRSVHIGTLPIPRTVQKDRTEIETLVEKCLQSDGPEREPYEAEIDERVASLYKLDQP